MTTFVFPKLQAEVVEILPESLTAIGIHGAHVFTTLEGHNPGGSIKDHMVLQEFKALMEIGKISRGALISEVSAGSTALSLAYYGKLLGLECHLFLPQDAPDETQKKLKELGAYLHLHERAVLYVKHEEFSKKNKSYDFNQLYDQKKTSRYHALGQHLKNELGSVDLLIGAVGTGHSLKGVATGLQARHVFCAEPQDFRVNGVRNIESDRYGEKDPLLLNDFEQRILVTQDECIAQTDYLVKNGSIRVGESFRLVLSAIKKISANKKSSRILALGANNKRI